MAHMSRQVLHKMPIRNRRYPNSTEKSYITATPTGAITNYDNIIGIAKNLHRISQHTNFT